MAVVVCSVARLRIAYLDESGDTAPLASATSLTPPVFVPAAVILKQTRIQPLTTDFLRLKQRYFPALMPRTGHYLDCVRTEIKGAEIRRDLRLGRKTLIRHHLGFLDQFMSLLEKHDAKIVGRVWIKGIGKPINPTALYTSSVQNICSYFHHFLEREDDVGFIVADSRTAPQNSQVAHSVFTQKFSLHGDRYERLLEMPTYGHSENHVGLQVTDLLCSALLFPMAAFVYCSGHVTSVHVNPAYERLRARYGARLKRLQYRYSDGHRSIGGIMVCDELTRRSGVHLFS